MTGPSGLLVIVAIFATVTFGCSAGETDNLSSEPQPWERLSEEVAFPFCDGLGLIPPETPASLRTVTDATGTGMVVRFDLADFGASPYFIGQRWLNTLCEDPSDTSIDGMRWTVAQRLGNAGLSGDQFVLVYHDSTNAKSPSELTEALSQLVSDLDDFKSYE